MTISEANKKFIDSLIDYYISESEAYRDMAEKYQPEISSVPDTSFGIIVGCVYSGFLQAYQNQQQSPTLEDIKEFHKILKEKAPQIKKSILHPIKTTTESEPKKED
ncbi:MAG: hypothetical protein R3327_02925 [Nitrosopumilaceae archaeon]|nr:hypothetical protein [Nitrosopumilaceae archaeon]